MLRQYLSAAALFLLLVSNSSISLANDESAVQAVHQAVETYCKIEFDGAWVDDRWAVIKFSENRKAERKYRDYTASSVFGLEHYPFIVISSYDIQKVDVLNPTHAIAMVAYSRVAHSASKTEHAWYLVADRKDNDHVTLNLVFERNKWWVLDPPPPRISKDVLIRYYEGQVKEDSAMWERKLSDPNYSEEQKANVRANQEQAVGTLKILKNLP